MRFYRKLTPLIVLLCFTTITAALAQSATCGPFVEQAMSAVEQDCARTGRNQACYGYVSMDATPREGITDFVFDKEGDLAPIADLQTLRLSALNTAADTWGIALMKLQANLPDTLPGQNVTFLLFGDVEIRNGVTPGAGSANVNVSAKSGANVRSLPTTNGDVIGSLAGGQGTTANGRNEDGTWLRIDIPGSSAQGWVFASLLNIAGDSGALPVVDTLEAAPFKPMQAFYFQTGISQTNCAEAPANGILIQTPKGAGTINLRANDVDIQLGSTAFFQARPSSQMVVSVVEGEGRVTARGKTVVVPAGAQVFIPVNSDLQASAAPSDPQPYPRELVAPLPVEVLPDVISIAPPASDAVIQQANLNIPTPTPQPTAEPTHTASLPDGSFPGGIDPSIFGGMDATQFCQYFMPVLQQAGFSKDQYLAMMQQVSGMVPADSRADFDQLLQMIGSCP